jgi:hypothetical protein
MLAFGDVYPDHPDADHFGRDPHGEVAVEPMAGQALAGPPGHPDVGDGLTGFQHLPIEGLDPGPDRPHYLGQASSLGLVGRETAEPGQQLVDVDDPELAVDEPDPDGGCGLESLQDGQ